MPGVDALPEETWAIVVGVNRCDLSPRRRLDGPVRSALRFAGWLARENVNADHIRLLLSPPPSPDEVRRETGSSDLAKVPVVEAIEDRIYAAFTDRSLRARGKLLIVYWAGHGVFDQETRRLLCADTTLTNPRNVHFGSLRNYLRSTEGPAFPSTVLLIDTCALGSVGARRPIEWPDRTFKPGPVGRNFRQFGLFASSENQEASPDETEGVGCLTLELLALLDVPAARRPVSLWDLVEQVRGSFDVLRREAKTQQTPAFFECQYRNWVVDNGTHAAAGDGEVIDAFGSETTRADGGPRGGPATTGVDQVLDRMGQQASREEPAFSVDVEFFLARALGTPEAPEPFGGRDDALDQLDRWARSSTEPRYRLLVARAGIGKSALLARWVARLTGWPGRDGAGRGGGDAAPTTDHVVFFPISAWFATNRQAQIFAELARQLARAFHDPPPGELNRTPEQWRRLVGEYLRKPMLDGRRLVVVIDGLDEAADWSPAGNLFPPWPPDTLRLLVSARARPDDPEGHSWLDALAWEQRGLAVTTGLEPLSVDGVAEVLRTVGDPVHRLGDEQAVVEELHRLSVGEPLTLSLYLNELRGEPELAGRLRVEDLAALEPGLRDYFKRWWKEQKELWGDRAPDREPLVRGLLELLACALGPLSRSDIEVLTTDAAWTNWDFEEVLGHLHRLVVGDGERGYTFSHPELAAYFAGELRPAQRLQTEQRFLRWGADTLARLNDGSVAPGVLSLYIVQYYSAHLERARAEAEHRGDTEAYATRTRELAALTCDGWRRAWQAMEGGYAGFLGDVARAWDAARCEDERLVAAGGVAAHLGIEARAALINASVVGASEQVSTGLVIAAAERGVLGTSQAVAFALTMPTLRRICVLAQLLPRVADADRARVIRQMIEAVRQLRTDKERVDLFCDLAPKLPESLLIEGLEIAGQLKYERELARLLRELIAQLPPRLVSRAFRAAKRVASDYLRSELLAALAPRIPPELFDEAVEASLGIPGPLSRAEALAPLLPRLSPETGLVALTRSLKSASQLREGFIEAPLLETLARILPPPLFPRLWRYITELEWDVPRGQALAAVGPRLPDELVADAFELAKAVCDVHLRIKTITGLFPRLPTELRSEAFDDLMGPRFLTHRAVILPVLAPHLPDDRVAAALERARELQDEGEVVRCVASLAPRLPDDLLASVLDDLARLRSDREREELADALFERLPASLQDRALEICRGFRDEYTRTQAYCRLLRALDDQHLGDVLAAADGLKHLPNRCELLVSLADRLPHESTESVYVEVNRVADTSLRLSTLVKLFPRLPEKRRNDVVKAVESVRFEMDRGELLSDLARVATGEWVRKLFLCARAMEGEPYLVRVMHLLIPRLPDDLLDDALALTERLKVDRHAVDLLVSLVPRLRGDAAHLGRALALARRFSGEFERCWALRWLASTLPDDQLPDLLADVGHLPTERYKADLVLALAPRLPADAVGEADQLVCRLHDVKIRYATRVALFPRLPEPRKREVFDLVLRHEQEWNQSDHLNDLAPHLPADWLPEAWACACAMENESLRSGSVQRLLPRLTEAQREGCLAVASRILSEYVRVDLLLGVAPKLPERCRPEVFRLARQLRDVELRGRALTYLIPVLPAVLREQALESALDTSRQVERQREQMHVIGVFCRWAPDALLPALQEEAFRLEDEWYRAEALLPIVARLPEADSAHAAGEAFEAAWAAPDDFLLTRVIRELGLRLPAPAVPRVLDRVAAIPNGFCRREILSAVAPCLRGEAVERALALARGIGDPYDSVGAETALARVCPACLDGAGLTALRDRARAIEAEHLRLPALLGLMPLTQGDERRSLLDEVVAAVGCHLSAERPRAAAAAVAALPGDLIDHALERVSQHPDDRLRTAFLSALAPRVSPGSLGRAWAIAHEVAEPKDRVRALLDLAARMSDAERAEAAGAALSLARDSSVPEDRLRALVHAAPGLAESEALAAFRLALGLGSERLVADGLSALAGRLPVSYVGEAIEAVHTMKDRHARDDLLVALAQNAPPDLLRRALELSQRIGDDHDREATLASLIADLPDDRAVETLPLIERLADQRARMNTLLELAPRLKKNAWPEALRLVGRAGSPDLRTSTLASMVRWLPRAHAVRAWELVLTIPDSSPTRGALLAAVAARIMEADWPHVLDSVGKKGGREREKILQVIAARVPPSYTRQVMAVARQSSDEWPKAEILTNLAPRLPDDACLEACHLAMGFANRSVRDRVLTALAPRLQEDLLRRALTTMIADEDSRSHRLLPFVSRLRPEQVPAQLRLFDAIEDEALIADLIALVTRWVPASNLPRLKKLAKKVKDPRLQERVKTLLESSEPPDSAPSAPDPVLQIEDERDRADAMLAAIRNREVKEPARWLSAALSMADDARRAAVAGALLPSLSGAELSRVFLAFQKLDDPRHWVGLLEHLPRGLPEPLLIKLLTATSRLMDDRLQSLALLRLRGQLRGGLWRWADGQAQAAAAWVEDASWRREVSRSLGRSYPDSGDDFVERLAAARRSDRVEGRLHDLLALVPIAHEAMRPVAFELWHEILKAVAQQGRGQVVKRLAELAPLALILQHGDADPEIARAVADVGAIWP